MDTPTSLTNVYATEEISVRDPRSPSWGAVFAGVVAGLGTHFLLLMLGTALGLGAAEPATDDNPLATFSTGTALVWSISALISLFVGGWVAGRCAARIHSVSGCLHGFLVWCVATIVGLFIVASGAGMLIGGSARIVGDGLKGAGKAAGGVAELAKQVTEQHTAALSSFIDEAAAGRDPNSAQAIAARREVGQAVRRMFVEGGDLKDAQNREALVRALTQAGGMAQAQAEQTVDRWVASAEEMRRDFEQAKTAAAAKAREVADKASDALAKAALWTFIGFVLGAIAASLGGRKGSNWEYRHHTGIGIDPTLDPVARRPRVNLSGNA